MLMPARAKAFEAVCLYIFLTSVTYTLAHAHTLGENPRPQKMTHSYIRLMRGSYCDKQFVACLTCVTTQPQVSHPPPPQQTPVLACADSEHESPNTNTEPHLTLCWPTNFFVISHIGERIKPTRSPKICFSGSENVSPPSVMSAPKGDQRLQSAVMNLRIKAV